jgi:hypothetical protein
VPVLAAIGGVLNQAGGSWEIMNDLRLSGLKASENLPSSPAHIAGIRFLILAKASLSTASPKDTTLFAADYLLVSSSPQFRHKLVYSPFN